MAPGAPVIHDKGPEARILDPARNIVAELHSHLGDVDKGYKEADFIHEGPMSPSASSTPISRPTARSPGSTAPGASMCGRARRPRS